MAERFSKIKGLSFSEKQMEICKYYCDNNMKRLKDICWRMLEMHTVPEYKRDDLYDDAMCVLLETLQSYDPEKSDNFGGYLYFNIKNSFSEYSRNQKAHIRCNYMIGSDGKRIQDKDGNDVVIPNIELDKPFKDDKSEKERDWSEVIGDGSNIEELICQKEHGEYEEWHPETKAFLHKLSPLQRKIALMIADRYEKEEICEILHISLKEYGILFKRMTDSDICHEIRVLSTRRI